MTVDNTVGSDGSGPRMAVVIGPEDVRVWTLDAPGGTPERHDPRPHGDFPHGLLDVVRAHGASRLDQLGVGVASRLTPEGQPLAMISPPGWHLSGERLEGVGRLVVRDILEIEAKALPYLPSNRMVRIQGWYDERERCAYIGEDVHGTAAYMVDGEGRTRPVQGLDPADWLTSPTEQERLILDRALMLSGVDPEQALHLPRLAHFHEARGDVLGESAESLDSFEVARGTFEERPPELGCVQSFGLWLRCLEGFVRCLVLHGNATIVGLGGELMRHLSRHLDAMFEVDLGDGNVAVYVLKREAAFDGALMDPPPDAEAAPQ